MTETSTDDASHHLNTAMAVADISPRGGTVRSIRDLWWLVARVVRSSPTEAAGWIALFVILGFELPIALWATKGVADSLQERLDGGAGAGLWWYALVWVGINGLSIVLEPLGDRFGAAVQERSSAALSANVLAKATRIDLASFEYQRFHDRFNLVLTSVEERANQAFRHIVQCFWALPRFVTSLGVLLLFDWTLALIAIIAILPAAWGWFFTGSLYWELWGQHTRDRRLAAYFAGLLTRRDSSAEVRLFGLMPAVLTRWEDAYWRAAREVRNRAVRVGLKQRGMSLASVTLSLLGLAWYVTTMSEVPSAGTVVIVIASYLDLYGGVLNLARPIQELGKSAGFATDTRTFLALPDEDDGRTMAMPERPAASELVLDRVTYTYPGATSPALNGISLRVGPGETVALVGENGAGKTTLVKLMLGLLQPDSGSISIDGVDLAEADPAAVRERLSGVFQHFTRYPLSAHDNVTLGGSYPDGAVEHALHVVGLSHLADRMPAGLDTILAPDLGGVDLSGGQWQRIAIARAGIRDASLVALDEPTASLDPLAEVAIFRRFADLAAGRTTILVSHRLGIARLADRIIALENGQLMESGPHNDLVARPDSVYARMWEAQAQWYR